MENTAQLTEQTVGQWLDPDLFDDLYQKVWDQGKSYFARMLEDGRVDLTIVFQNIDDFGESSGSQLLIDYKIHKDTLFLIVWTLTDPKNPLGFPIPFKLTEPDDLLLLKRIFEQKQIWIHYLAIENEHLIHVFSEAYEIPDSEKHKISNLFNEQQRADDQVESNEEDILVKDADKLLDNQLLAEGIGYSLDYTAMIKKGNEESAKEKLMSALLQGLMMIKRHPRSDVRESSFLLWVEEKRESTRQGDDARLITIYMTPMLNELFEVVSNHHQDENPFTSVLFGFPEFLITVQRKPLDHGAFPILEYKGGMLMHLELDDAFLHRLSGLYSGDGENPYRV